jgi:hypothetical protein
VVGDLGLILKVQVIWILHDNATALAVTNNNSITLFTINLTTGKATSIGKFSVPVISIALKRINCLCSYKYVIPF